MSTLKTHNLQSPDASSVNIAMAPNAGIVVTGISTFNNDIRLPDNKILKIGDGQDLELLHTGVDSIIRDTTGKLRIRSNDLKLEDGSTNDYIECNLGADVILYYNNSAKLATTNTGVTVTGTVAATAYTGDGSQLTNLPPSAPVGGASSNQVFFENDKFVGVGYSITNTKNAMSAGPISINAGIAVTVPSGCSWTIV